MKINLWLPLLVLAACGPADLGELDPPSAPDEVAAQAGADATLVQSEAALRGPILRITVVDVGQGDGILVQFPNGRTMAVDGGPNTTDFAGHLREQGVDDLDYVVLSHAHADHYTGLAPVLDLLPPGCGKRILNPGYDRDTATYQDFASAAGCRYKQTRVGEAVLADPSVSVRVMYAADTLSPSDQSHGVNNTSVVLQLRFRSFSMLLQGDAEAEVEQAMWLDRGAGLRSTVLKVGHHGSCTASATRFLRAVAPQYLVMSVATGNNFGLPHCQTMAKLKGLKARGARWARTDVNGTVSIATDGTRYTVRRARGAESVDACPRDCGAPQDF